MTGPRRALALGLFFAACDKDPLASDGLIVDASGRVGRLDSGWDGGLGVRLEAGASDGRTEDAQGVDAGRADAQRQDSAPDVGPPPCVCPALPATCEPLEPNVPAFTPPAGEALASLFSVLACADSTFHAAFYETTWPCVAEAMSARLAADPDLVMELVLDDDECPRNAGRLTCAFSILDGHPRVRVVLDDRSALMHHKFAVADRRVVWAGSANLSERSFCTDFNDTLLIDEPQIVAAFEREMDRLFRDRTFGPREPEPPAKAGEYTVYFGPVTPSSSSGVWFDELARRVATASVSVDFAISAFTRSEIAESLLITHRRGVPVRGLVSSGYANDVPARLLIEGGVPIRKGNIHAKLAIIDGVTVVTGSPNWSAQAWENNEASIWIESSTVARAYRAGFDRQYAQGLPP
ncbi:MAG: hypothetical protein HY791_13650 [Deltaproteobacteria bacterium]|nr:hypothetical protein [Deltaproteobacteria bacterium]